MVVDARKWRLIEQEDAEQEGYIIVPADGSYARYASQSALNLFQSEEIAQNIIHKMVAVGKVGIGEVMPVRARLVHHRTVEILDAPVRLIVSNDEVEEEVEE